MTPMPISPSKPKTQPPRTRKKPGEGSGLRLGAVSGFEVTLDYSWFILFFLILSTFTGGIFPAQAPGLSRPEYFLMGLTGTFLFFGSLLLHELAHAFMARRKGLEIEGITLFIFGGMARVKRDAESPGDEFLIAGVGPLASFLLAGIFSGLARIGGAFELGLGATVLLEYLGFLNLVLALFNLFPGFPLDGGRLLRAVVWRVTGSLRKATQIATLSGRLLGWGIVGLGVFSIVVGGGFVGGLWLVFIGWFLTHAARSSYQQLLLVEMMGPLTAREVMSPDPESVPPDLPVGDLVHDYFLRRPYNSFPVIDDGVVVGLVTLGQVKQIPREAWDEFVVGGIMSPLVDTILVAPETPMPQVLERMRETNTRRVLVAREWELMGIISASDVARWLDRVSLVE